MTGHLSAADAPLALDTAWLLDRCEQADFDSAAELLRLGPLAGRARLAAAPPDVARLSAVAWQEMERAPASEEPRAARLGALLSGLAAVGGDVAVLVGCEPGGAPGVWLGLSAHGGAAAWSARLLAPGHLLGAPGPLPVAASAALVHSVRAAQLRLAPAHASQGEEKLVGLLQRLLSLPGDGWALLIHARPVAGVDAAEGVRELHRAAAACARQLTRTEQRDETRTLTVADAGAERAKAWIELLAQHADEARGEGAWSVRIHLAADPAQLGMLSGALHGALPRPLGGDATWIVEDMVVDGREEAAPALLGSGDLAALLTTPEATVARLEVAEPLPAARRSLSARQPLSLGNWLGVPDPATIGIEDLEGHAFVCGVTGSGKSTTAARLLLGLWNAHGIPFLVLDPVKSDYEQLGGVIRDGLEVVSARDLALNALAPWPGFDPVTHLGFVATAFRGSFSMPSPVPYVLSRVFDTLQDRAGLEPAPTLHDLRSEVEAMIPELGYRGEIEDNIRAALGTRLAVLTSPTRAERLAAADSSLLARLLVRPSVVHLADLGDEEERAFATTLLMLYVAEAARTRGATPGVAHVTVLEEAHRILPQPASPTTSENSGDASSVAARLMTQLLAEIRSYGESMIVVDQSPYAVARDVVRNTNLKIAHRVVDPDDREVLGGSLGLPEDATGAIGRLRVGEALITSRRLLDPQAMRVTVTHFGSRPAPVEEGASTAVSRRPCCAGDPGAEAHHISEAAGAAAEHLVHLALVAEMDGRRGALRPALLARHEARYPGSRGACLVWVGLRRALWRYARLGYATPAEVADLLGRAFSSFLADGTLGDTPAVLADRAARMAVPFAACSECAARCRVRPLVVDGLEGRLSRLRDALRRAPAGREHNVLIAAAAEVGDALAGTLEKSAAGATALCMVAHAAQREGHGDDMTLARLRALDRTAR